MSPLMDFANRLALVLFILVLAFSACHKKVPTAPVPNEDPEDPASIETLTVELPGGVRMEFVKLAPGNFMMGSPSGENALWSDDEFPLHPVTISKGFYVGKYPVTQAQWTSVMVNNPSANVGTQRPVERVSWVDVQRFIDRLNQAAGADLYRLPTEAEWEYACRAGTETRWSFGNDERQLEYHAWYSENNIPDGPKEVGQKLPNPWGLYDMHGNVWEWCQDWYGSYSDARKIDPQGPPTGQYRVLRGGDFGRYALFVRSASRRSMIPAFRDHSMGFRVLRRIE